MGCCAGSFVNYNGTVIYGSEVEDKEEGEEEEEEEEGGVVLGVKGEVVEDPSDSRNRDKQCPDTNTLVKLSRRMISSSRHTPSARRSGTTCYTAETRTIVVVYAKAGCRAPGVASMAAVRRGGGREIQGEDEDKGGGIGNDVGSA